MRPPAWNGLLKAIALDLAMIVLSRSKKAAVVTSSPRPWLHRIDPPALHSRTAASGSPHLPLTGLRRPAPAGRVRAMDLHRPLIATADPTLADELARLAA